MSTMHTIFVSCAELLCNKPLQNSVSLKSNNLFSHLQVNWKSVASDCRSVVGGLCSMGHFLRGWQRTQAEVLLEYSVLATAITQEGKWSCARMFKPLYHSCEHWPSSKKKVERWTWNGFIGLIWDQWVSPSHKFTKKSNKVHTLLGVSSTHTQFSDSLMCSMPQYAEF